MQKELLSPDLQIRRWRHREVQKVIPSHTATRSQTLDGNPGSAASDSLPPPWDALTALRLLIPSTGVRSIPAHPRPVRRSSHPPHSPTPCLWRYPGRLPPSLSLTRIRAPAAKRVLRALLSLWQPGEGDISAARGAQKSLGLSLCSFIQDYNSK